LLTSALAGLLIFFGFKDLKDSINKAPTIGVPGAQEFELGADTSVLLVADATSEEAAKAVKVSVIDGSGKGIGVKSGGLTLSVGAKSGHFYEYIGGFSVGSKTKIAITTTGPEGAVLRVTNPGGAEGKWGGAILLGGFGFVLSFLTFIIMLVRRSGSKKKIAAGQGSGPAGGYTPPPAQPQQYAPPAQPQQYAPPAQPQQYAPPAQPQQYAPPAQPQQYAPPAQPQQYAPPPPPPGAADPGSSQPPV
jgi:hypothetical protein